MSDDNTPTTRPHEPATGSEYGCGMTKREYFAALVLAQFAGDDTDDGPKASADAAVRWADALIAALNAPPK